MRRSRRIWWLVWSLCAAVALAALAGLSLLVLELERSELAARAESAHQEDLRLALWRMDGWFAPRLARESARPYFEYQAYYPQERLYTRILNPIQQGEVLSPSPLLTFRSEYVRLHFQLDQDGVWSSPQLPTGNWLDLSQSNGLGREDSAELTALIEGLRGRIDFPGLDRFAGENWESINRVLANDESLQSEAAPSQQRSRQELAKRAQSAYQVAEGDGLPAEPSLDTGGGARTGALVPVWIDGSGESREPALCFVRRVQVGSTSLLQGFLTSWPRLRSALIAEASDLFGEARLVPLLEEADGIGGSVRRLAAIPANLEVPSPIPPSPGLLTPARWTLVITWCLALLALATAATTLRASIAYGEKRSRFASTVTHELRSPLTTFRMYSEMLARGMVAEERRGEYLETLQQESDRLARLVENVLAYARLEEGRLQLRSERTTVGALLERVLPDLERRAAEAGAQLSVEAGPGARREPRDRPGDRRPDPLQPGGQRLQVRSHGGRRRDRNRRRARGGSARAAGARRRPRRPGARASGDLPPLRARRAGRRRSQPGRGPGPGALARSGARPGRRAGARGRSRAGRQLPFEASARKLRRAQPTHVSGSARRG